MGCKRLIYIIFLITTICFAVSVNSLEGAYDTCQEAIALPLNSQEVGILSSSTDQDWYSVDFSPQGKLTSSLTSAQGYQLSLYSSCGANPICTSTTNCVQDPALGTYYMKVASSGTVDGSVYTIGTLFENTAKKADLVWHDLWLNDNPAGDSTSTIYWQIKNQGSQINQPTTIKFYIDGLLLHVASSKNPLLENEFDSGSFDLTTPVGDHTIRMELDTDNEVEELDESNNIFEKTLSWPTGSKDITITRIYANNVPKPGGTYIINYELYNKGSLPLDYLWSSLHINGAAKGTSRTQQVLQPQEKIIQSFTGTYATAGTHEVKIVADYDNQISESDETNNEKISSITWIDSPDLDAITVDLSSTCTNNPITITSPVRNLANTDVSQPFYSEISIDGSLVEKWSESQVLANSVKNHDTVVTLSPGTHTIKFEVDSTKVVNELNELNNVYETQLEFTECSKPDITIIDIYPSAGLDLEKASIISYVIKNSGTVDSGSFEYEILVDGIQEKIQTIDNLKPNETVTYSIVKSYAEPSTHTIKVIVDTKNQVDELQENNNEKSETFSWENRPDLQIIDFKIPTNTCAENITDISFYISNWGKSISNSQFITELKIDNKKITEWSDEKLDRYQTRKKQYSINLAPGKHKIEISIDTTKTIEESIEQNNLFDHTIDLVSCHGKNLILEDIYSVPPYPTSDESFSIIYTIKNQGETINDFFANQLLYDNGTLIDYCETTGPLAANETLTCTHEFSNGLTKGTYYFLGQADMYDNINESYLENDNINLLILPISDLTILQGFVKPIAGLADYNGDFDSNGDGISEFSTLYSGNYQSSQEGLGYHPGVDIRGSVLPADAPIYSIARGIIYRAGWHKDWGNHVIIQHEGSQIGHPDLGTFYSIYGHLKSFTVNNGEIVSRGEPIGIIGSSGKSTGVHLHFQIDKSTAGAHPYWPPAGYKNAHTVIQNTCNPLILVQEGRCIGTIDEDIESIGIIIKAYYGQAKNTPFQEAEVYKDGSSKGSTDQLGRLTISESIIEGSKVKVKCPNEEKLCVLYPAMTSAEPVTEFTIDSFAQMIQKQTIYAYCECTLSCVETKNSCDMQYQHIDSDFDLTSDYVENILGIDPQNATDDFYAFLYSTNIQDGYYDLGKYHFIHEALRASNIANKILETIKNLPGMIKGLIKLSIQVCDVTHYPQRIFEHQIYTSNILTMPLAVCDPTSEHSAAHQSLDVFLDETKDIDLSNYELNNQGITKLYRSLSEKTTAFKTMDYVAQGFVNPADPRSPTYWDFVKFLNELDQKYQSENLSDNPMLKRSFIRGAIETRIAVYLVSIPIAELTGEAAIGHLAKLSKLRWTRAIDNVEVSKMDKIPIKTIDNLDNPSSVSKIVDPNKKKFFNNLVKNHPKHTSAIHKISESKIERVSKIIDNLQNTNSVEGLLKIIDAGTEKEIEVALKTLEILKKEDIYGHIANHANRAFENLNNQLDSLFGTNVKIKRRRKSIESHEEKIIRNLRKSIEKNQKGKLIEVGQDLTKVGDFTDNQIRQFIFDNSEDFNGFTIITNSKQEQAETILELIVNDKNGFTIDGKNVDIYDSPYLEDLLKDAPETRDWNFPEDLKSSGYKSAHIQLDVDLPENYAVSWGKRTFTNEVKVMTKNEYAVSTLEHDFYKLSDLEKIATLKELKKHPLFQQEIKKIRDKLESDGVPSNSLEAKIDQELIRQSDEYFRDMYKELDYFEQNPAVFEDIDNFMQNFANKRGCPAFVSKLKKCTITSAEVLNPLSLDEIIGQIPREITKISVDIYPAYTQKFNWLKEIFTNKAKTRSFFDIDPTLDEKGAQKLIEFKSNELINKIKLDKDELTTLLDYFDNLDFQRIDDYDDFYNLIEGTKEFRRISAFDSFSNTGIQYLTKDSALRTIKAVTQFESSPGFENLITRLITSNDKTNVKDHVGEILGANDLFEKGYTILRFNEILDIDGSNMEIDLIAKFEGKEILIEVKNRNQLPVSKLTDDGVYRLDKYKSAIDLGKGDQAMLLTHEARTVSDQVIKDLIDRGISHKKADIGEVIP